MMPRSPSTQGSSSSPARVPPRTQSPRWHGNPYQRPPTDAEIVKSRRRNRSLLRFISSISLALLFGFVLAPRLVLHALSRVSPRVAPLAARVGWWLQVAYPFVKAGLLILLGYILLHLCIGVWTITRQIV